METTKYSRARAPGREHIPIYPNGFIAIRIALLVVAVVVLGLDAYGLSIFVFAGDSLNIFTVRLPSSAVAKQGNTRRSTDAIAGHRNLDHLRVLHCRRVWSSRHLQLLGNPRDIFLVVFWLVSFALMASEVAPFLRTYTECYYGVCETYQLDGYSRQYADCMAAVAGLGGLALYVAPCSSLLSTLSSCHPMLKK